jgi:hypothetical protein
MVWKETIRPSRGILSINLLGETEENNETSSVRKTVVSAEIQLPISDELIGFFN